MKQAEQIIREQDILKLTSKLEQSIIISSMKEYAKQVTIESLRQASIAARNLFDKEGNLIDIDRKQISNTTIKLP